MLWLVNRWQSVNIVSITLWPLSLIYCFLVTVRQMAYQTGLLKRHAVGLPVIIVGNLTVGGTGKTPFVIWLVNWLKSQGHRPGIVLRGYGGHSTTWPREVTPEVSAIEVGDEAVLLAARTACPVVAAPDRVAAAQWLVNRTGCNIIVSDDGLQHYRLRRDFEILVVDGKRGYGNGFCLPAGPLRESVSRAKKVDIEIVNGKAQEGALTMEITPIAFRNLISGERVPLSHFKGKTVHAIAGIGNPTRFFDTLQSTGTDSVNHPFPDHYQFNRGDLELLDDQDIVMTEKDAVKCAEFAGEKCWALEIDAVPTPAIAKIIQTWVEESNIG